MKVGDQLKFKKGFAEQISSFFKRRHANLQAMQDLIMINEALVKEAWKCINEMYPESVNFELSWNIKDNTCTVLKSKDL